MPIGIAAPQPSGIPGFNLAGMYVTAGMTAGIVNARPLPGWYNILRSVPVANGPVTLPPATCGGQEVVVWNYSNYIAPLTGVAPGVSNTAVVFGNVNPFGAQDTIAAATGGTQVTTGVAVAPNAMVLFYVMRPQAGFTNAWLPGQWQFKILA